MPCSRLETREGKMNETISLLLNSLLANYMVSCQGPGVMLMSLGLGCGGRQSWVGAGHSVCVLGRD